MVENSREKFNCLLSAGAKAKNACKRPNCENCGWEEHEAMHRHEYIAENGLVECEDGLRRFIRKAAESAKNLGDDTAPGA